MKNNIKYLLSCFLVLTSCFLKAQEAKNESNRTIDSLLNVVQNLSSLTPEIKSLKGSDTILINTLNQLSWQYIITSYYEKALKHTLEAQQLAETLNYKKGTANSYNNLGSIYWYQGNYEKGLENHLKALKIREEKPDKNEIAASYNNIGMDYYAQGNYAKALDCYLKSLKISEEIGNKDRIADTFNNIGIIYDLQGNYEKALYNYFKSLTINKEIGDKQGVATAYNNIGIVYEIQGNKEKALDNYLKSLKIHEEIGDQEGVAIAYSNIGNIYFNKGNFKKSLENNLKALTIRDEIGDKNGIAMSYNNIANIYMMQNRFEESYNYLNKALIIAKEIGNKDGIKEKYISLSKLYEKKRDYKQAYNYHKLYSDIKDTLLNEQSSRQITEMNTKYESEKKEKDIELLIKDKSLQQAEIGKQKFLRNGTIGGFVFALLLAFILFNRFRVTTKQKKIIESQNFQIVESINYSKKIQDSLLPSIENMQKSIPDLFVFYEPKAIVSGDFYYFKEFEKYTLLACVDCTGHGVPGGFMSTLGSLLLDKIADNERLSPSEILYKLSNEIIRVLHQQDGGEIQDGMDLSICLIDSINHKIEFSGARNGIIVVSNEQAKRYKADPLPVGGNYMKKGIAIERNFKTQHIPISSNDWIYMYTDGFMEQVGGAEGIPMNYTQFENQLISVSKKQTQEEKNRLLQTELDNWRGTHERDDDVLIIGFQIVS